VAEAIAGPKKAKAKGRKLGRNSARCKAYRDRGQREKNRKRRIAREARRLARLKREPAHTRRAAGRADRRVAVRRVKAAAAVHRWTGTRPTDLVDEARTALVHAQATEMFLRGAIAPEEHAKFLWHMRYQNPDGTRRHG